MENNVFELRCQNDPQGVIKDLLGQTQRQGGEIFRLNQLVEGILTAPEAAHLITVVKAQSAEVSRDFPKEDMEEIILKKLEKIVTAVAPKVKKTRKKKEPVNDTNDAAQ